jgi:ribosomal protein S18 acetylase RimI-like enzyme
MFDIKALPKDCLSLIAQIDRSEHIESLFEVVDGELTNRPADIDVQRWALEGDGPNSVQGLVDYLGPILDRGATLLGALEHKTLAGVAIVEEHFEDNMAWFVFLHVSNAYRRNGVGTALWNEAIERARSAGADSMYVSATPSTSAVGFYIQRGCQLAPEPHSALHEAEPDDIHLIATID